MERNKRPMLWKINNNISCTCSVAPSKRHSRTRASRSVRCQFRFSASPVSARRSAIIFFQIGSNDAQQPSRKFLRSKPVNSHTAWARRIKQHRARYVEEPHCKFIGQLAGRSTGCSASSLNAHEHEWLVPRAGERSGAVVTRLNRHLISGPPGEACVE